MSEIAEPRPRRVLPLVAAAGVVAGLIALSPHLSGVAGDHPEPQRAVAPAPRPVPTPVYELSARAPGGADAGRAWIDPQRGSWRVQEGDTGAVLSGTTLERSGPSGTYLQRGLTRAFLGERAHLTVADAIGLYAAGRQDAVVSGHRLQVTGHGTLHVRLDGRPFLTLQVVRRLTRAQAPFAIDPRHAATSDVELRPGAAPSVPVRAYWPGQATTAFEHRAAAPQDDSVTVRSGALQVRSEPAESAQARSDLALYRTWTPRSITLADGTRARLYTFTGGLAVLAGDTLVTLLGPATAADAAGLRALPAPLPPAGPGAR